MKIVGLFILCIIVPVLLWAGSDKTQDVSGPTLDNAENISFVDVKNNSGAYVGKKVDWQGFAVCKDKSKGKTRYFVNSNTAVNALTNMEFCFGVIFPEDLPDDPRISIYSKIQVKGIVLGAAKIFNSLTSVFSSGRQPIIEATEAIFIRKNYEQPLVLRFNEKPSEK